MVFPRHPERQTPARIVWRYTAHPGKHSGHVFSRTKLTKTQEFISVLDYFEKHVIVAHTDPGYRKAFRIGEPLSYFIANHEAEGLQICSNDKQTYHLANVLFNYRIVDIASWMKSSFKPLLPLQGVRRGKLPIPQLSRLVCMVLFLLFISF